MLPNQEYADTYTTPKSLLTLKIKNNLFPKKFIVGSGLTDLSVLQNYNMIDLRQKCNSVCHKESSFVRQYSIGTNHFVKNVLPNVTVYSAQWVIYIKLKISLSDLFMIEVLAKDSALIRTK